MNKLDAGKNDLVSINSKNGVIEIQTGTEVYKTKKESINFVCVNEFPGCGNLIIGIEGVVAQSQDVVADYTDAAVSAIVGGEDFEELVDRDGRKFYFRKSAVTLVRTLGTALIVGTYGCKTQTVCFTSKEESFEAYEKIDIS